MATRRARFKPVLNQPARRGRPGAPEGSSAEAVKDNSATSDPPEKTSPATSNQKAAPTVTRPEVSNVSVNNTPCETNKTTSDSEVLKSSQQSDGVSSSADESSKEKNLVKVSSSQQSRTPVATSSKQDAVSATVELPKLPPPRPTTPLSDANLRAPNEISSPAKTESSARSNKEERKETAPSVKQRRAPSSTNQRALAARRNFMKLAKDGPPERSSLTMFDLIFYNPVTNPMPNKSPPPAQKRDRLSSTCSVSTVHEERLAEEKVDDVDDNHMKESEDKENKEEKEEEEEEEPAVPVPRVKVGPDGRIIIDEQSLVIETTETKKTRAEMEKSEVVFDTGLSNGFYKRTKRSKDWSNRDTLKFYRALQVYGTDFSLMQVLFKDRTRKELKLKFKKEEKMRGSVIDKALCSPLDFDTTDLEKEAQKEEEEEEAARLAKEKEEQEKLKPKIPKQKKRWNASLAQKEMSGPDCPNPPPKKKVARKSKVNKVDKSKDESIVEPPKTGLDIFDDIVLPTDPVPSTSSAANKPKKKTKPAAPKKRKAPPGDPSQPPKKTKKKVNALMSPESDHSYAASPSRTPRTNGTPVSKPKNVETTPKPSTSNNNIEESPGYLTINLSDHVMLTPPRTQTVILPNEFSPQYTNLQTPRTPVIINVPQSAGLPTEFRSPSGPAPNRAVPVITVPSPTTGVLSPSGPAPNRAMHVITLPTSTAGIVSPSGPAPNRAMPVIALPTLTAGLPSPSGPAPNRAVPVIALPTQSADLPMESRSPSGPAPNRAVPITAVPSPTTGVRSPSGPAPNRTVPVIALPTQSAGLPTECRSPSGSAPSRAVSVITLPVQTAGLVSPSGTAPNRAMPVITLPAQTAGLVSPSGTAPNRAMPVITLPAQTAGLVSPSGTAPNRAMPVITLPTLTAGVVSPSGPSPNSAVSVITLPTQVAGVPSSSGPAANKALGPTPRIMVPVQPRSPKVSQVEPGSLYVLQTQDPNDPKRKVFGVYMVTNSQPKVASSPLPEPVPLVGNAAKTPSDSMSQAATVKDPVEGTVLTKL